MFDMIYRNAGTDKNTPPRFSDGENIIDWLLTNHSVIGRTVSSRLHVENIAQKQHSEKSISRFSLTYNAVSWYNYLEDF